MIRVSTTECANIWPPDVNRRESIFVETNLCRVDEYEYVNLRSYFSNRCFVWCDCGGVNL